MLALLTFGCFGYAWVFARVAPTTSRNRVAAAASFAADAARGSIRSWRGKTSTLGAWLNQEAEKRLELEP